MTTVDRTGPKPGISAKVKELGYELPSASLPAANYASWTQCGCFLHIAGQISKHGEKPAFVGKVGRDGANSPQTEIPDGLAWAVAWSQSRNAASLLDGRASGQTNQ
ncbi:hypothetical protein C8K44_1486 [Aminobacter sp. AP02]|nr:hypothetical protein C8K44_1486 [Aminobacter sp. AP02]